MKRIVRLNAIVTGLCRGVMYLAGPSISAKAVATSTGVGTAVPDIQDVVDVLSFVIFSQKAFMELRWQHVKLTDIQMNYFDVTGKKYINSRHNRTN